MSCLQHHCFAPHVTPAKRGPLPAERALRHVSAGDTFAPDGFFWQLSALDNAAVRDRHIPASSACAKLDDRMAVTNNSNPNGSPKFDPRPFIAFAPSDSTFTNRTYLCRSGRLLIWIKLLRIIDRLRCEKGACRMSSGNSVREAPQIAQARIAGTEIVHHDCHAHPVERLKLSHDASELPSGRVSVISSSSRCGTRPASFNVAATMLLTLPARNCAGDRLTATVRVSGHVAALRQASRNTHAPIRSISPNSYGNERQRWRQKRKSSYLWLAHCFVDHSI